MHDTLNAPAGGTASSSAGEGPDFERLVQTEGEHLLDLMDRLEAPSLFSRKGAYARLMDWSMTDPAFKTQLFRFVDVLPSLHSAAEVVRHLQEYLGPRASEISPLLKGGLSAAGWAPALVAAPVKSQVTAMARQFVAGESAQDLVKRFRHNARNGVATTIDLLGETVVSEAEADRFVDRNKEVLATLAEEIRRHPEPCFSDTGPSGPLPRLNLSLKVSALSPDVNVGDPETALPALKTRLRPLLRLAASGGAFINFDMESHRYKDLTLSLFTSILEEPEFQRAPAAGIAIQAYLRDSDKDLGALIDWARNRSRPVTVRLVKGAYWDYETVLAAQRGWPVPVWSNKADTDAAFERLSRMLLDAGGSVSAAFATHNVRSCAQAIAYARQRAIEPLALEFQALYGMADDLKAALVKHGYRVREYCPMGELLPGMAYLVRRLLENTSNEGFLRARHTGAATRAQLLSPPQRRPAPDPAATPPPSPTGFDNAPNTDFSRADRRGALSAALARRRAVPARVLPLGLRGAAPPPRETIPSVNPAHPAEILGHWTRATVADADAAVAGARAAQRGWGRMDASTRIALFLRAADLMERRRFDLAALEVLEAGKPWLEADADISEAIDFCRFYAREADHLCRFRPTQPVAGERNLEHAVPRGVGVVIAPWNFPLAILCGMAVAGALVGNTVIVKPAEQTSLIACAFADILDEAGLPPGVMTFLTGFGEDVGAHLVGHPDVDFVAFTGSRAVGLKIWETVAKTVPGQRNLKRAVCEMGGKNALIIDSDADWDEAIPAVLYSAFGFSGQKCSALSRLILHQDIAKGFTERLVSAAAALRIGDPAEAGTVVGPLIDAEAKAKVERYVEIGRTEAKLAFSGKIATELQRSGGFYAPPCIFTEVAPHAAIARDEIFGPVLAVLTARNLDEAFALANGSEYALTTGLFSRSPTALARARMELDAGNVYLNRGITGALVGRHPFGGYRMSGGGTKAGGTGYLENFVFSRVVSENTLRRGFTDDA